MRNVIVTGGSRGLGLGIAQRLADDGFRVIAVARRESEGSRRPRGATADAIAASSLRPRRHRRASRCSCSDLRQRIGPLYGFVNNAGIGTEGLLATMPDGDIEALIRLNTLSPFC